MGDRSEGREIDTGTDTVHAYIRQGIGVIALNRPDRRNALHHDMYPAMRALLDVFDRSDEVGCVVLTGEGKGFCAGGDVRDRRPRKPDGTRYTAEERAANLADDAQVVVLLHEHPKLTIAAVNGAAVGAGLSLALACDLRIVTRSAKFVTGWANLALAGDFGGAWLLTRLVGPAKALELLASNATIDAEEAEHLRLVNRVVDDDVFADEWPRWAAKFAAGPREAIASMKRNVADAFRMALVDAIPAESMRMAESSMTPDHKEGVRAWIDKRPPVFGQGSA